MSNGNLRLVLSLQLSHHSLSFVTLSEVDFSMLEHYGMYCSPIPNNPNLGDSEGLENRNSFATTIKLFTRPIMHIITYFLRYRIKYILCIMKIT